MSQLTDIELVVKVVATRFRGDEGAVAKVLNEPVKNTEAPTELIAAMRTW
jgi:hypothetical protein